MEVTTERLDRCDLVKAKGRIDSQTAPELEVLRDSGQSFDPDRVPHPGLQAPLEDRDGGGLGLHFIRRLMDRIRFEFTAEWDNVLTLVKRKEAAS